MFLLFVLSLLVSPVALVQSVQTYTYNGHWYALTSTATDWTSAGQEAQSSGGYLVSIGSAGEQAFLVSTFAYATYYEALPLWIGLSRVCIGCSEFQWASGEAVEYTDWKSGEPNDEGGVEWVVSMNWYDGTTYFPGQWNDCPEAGTQGYSANSNGPYVGIMEFEQDPNPSTDGSSSSSSSASMAVIVGPAVGGAVFLLALFVLLCCFMRYRRRGAAASASDTAGAVPMQPMMATPVNYPQPWQGASREQPQYPMPPAPMMQPQNRECPPPYPGYPQYVQYAQYPQYPSTSG